MLCLPNHFRSIAAVIGAGVVPLTAAVSASAAGPNGSATVPSAAPPPVTVELISRGTVDAPFEAESAGIELETERVIDVAVVRVTYPPGSTSGWHTHPGPTVVTATQGTFTHVLADCTRHSIAAGETFIEEGPQELGTLRNTGSTTAEIIITFFVPTGADPLTVPAPAPPCRR